MLEKSGNLRASQQSGVYFYALLAS